MKILVVEDNPSDVGLLTLAFQELNSGAVISVARDGDECLDLLFGTGTNHPAAHPDLIFLDLSLPTVSGYEVLKRIKGDAKTRHIPVIVLSSVSNGAEIERAYAAHANAYVRKPGSLADLMTAARGLKSFWMETARLASTLAGE